MNEKAKLYVPLVLIVILVAGILAEHSLLVSKDNELKKWKMI